jgi:carboxyl-terminal processing protease
MVTTLLALLPAQGMAGEASFEILQQAAKVLRDQTKSGMREEDFLMRAIAGMSEGLGVSSQVVTYPYKGTDHLRRLEVESALEAPRLLQGGIGYIRLRSLDLRSGKEVRAALEEFEIEGLQGLILDLRDNRGGRLEEAQEIAAIFLPPGTIIGWEQNGVHNPVPRVAEGKGPRPYPLVVLINGDTASAAEVLAGGLWQHGRAVLIGQPTAGKGTIQTAFPLGRGYVLWLTTGEYLLPDQRRLTGGLKPDLIVSSNDRLLERAIEILHGMKEGKGSH